ncbi:hypothetical protein [Limosilactobacillus difficilis]|uniref:hypothetical protein n=1 Tax=Limosilactobacillus difficilis TaxID=2991838 RepID=UPI0024BBC04F|nr:hypothetical protein [Limosilactobacillus difficilis]
MSQDFHQKLEELRLKKIDSFTVNPDDFMEFQRVFHDYEYRTQIEGDAGRKGIISYHRINQH